MRPIRNNPSHPSDMKCKYMLPQGLSGIFSRELTSQKVRNATKIAPLFCQKVEAITI